MILIHLCSTSDVLYVQVLELTKIISRSSRTQRRKFIKTACPCIPESWGTDHLVYIRCARACKVRHATNCYEVKFYIARGETKNQTIIIHGSQYLHFWCKGRHHLLDSTRIFLELQKQQTMSHGASLNHAFSPFQRIIKKIKRWTTTQRKEKKKKKKRETRSFPRAMAKGVNKHSRQVSVRM